MLVGEINSRVGNTRVGFCEEFRLPKKGLRGAPQGTLGFCSVGREKGQKVRMCLDAFLEMLLYSFLTFLCFLLKRFLVCRTVFTF